MMNEDEMLEMLQKEYDAIQRLRYKSGMNIAWLVEAFEIKKAFAEQVVGLNILIRRDKLEWQKGW